MKFSILALSIAISSQPLFADQCAWNSEEVANLASPIIFNSGEVYSFCRQCSDKIVKKIVVESVEIENVDSEYYEVKINGKGFDLAYLYDSQGKNIGLMAGCEANTVKKISKKKMKNAKNVRYKKSNIH